MKSFRLKIGSSPSLFLKENFISLLNQFLNRTNLTFNLILKQSKIKTDSDKEKVLCIIN